MAAHVELLLIPPDGWREVHLDPQSRGHQIDEAIAPLGRVTADWRRISPSVRRYLQQAYAQAWQSGIRYVITTQPDPVEIVNIMATFMVAMLPSSTPDGTNQLDAIVEGLAREQDALEDGERLDLSRTTVKALGPAVQAAGIRFLPDSQGAHTDHMIAELRTFIPWDDYVIVATGVTPQINLSDTLFTLFARITDTLSARQADHAPHPQTPVARMS